MHRVQGKKEHIRQTRLLIFCDDSREDIFNQLQQGDVRGGREPTQFVPFCSTTPSRITMKTTAVILASLIASASGFAAKKAAAPAVKVSSYESELGVQRPVSLIRQQFRRLS
jgi:hypothetical protein